MAHHRLANDSAAIFSPSVARIAASTARDWSYIDTWLSSKFPPNQIPSFERNPDTLRALLALASFNEAADEERNLLLRAETTALHELNSRNGVEGLRGALLAAVENELPREGEVALEGMANMAVQAGLAFPEPEDLGRRMIDLQNGIHYAEQMEARIQILQRHIERDAERMTQFIHDLQSDNFKPPSNMAKQNLDIQRKVKTMAAQLPDLQDRVAALASSINTCHPNIDDIAREEEEYLVLVSRKKQLGQQMAVFEGLPSDPDMARSELNALKNELRGATFDRDAVFEGLVERESPVKRRSNRFA